MVTISRIYKVGERAYVVVFGYNKPDESEALKAGAQSSSILFRSRRSLEKNGNSKSTKNAIGIQVTNRRIFSIGADDE